MVLLQDANISPSPSASSIFLPLGRVVRRDSRTSSSHDADQAAVNEALNSIHSAASQSQDLTVFNEYTDAPSSSSRIENKTITSDIQGGLTGLYHKLKASVSGLKDDGPQHDSTTNAKINNETSSSRIPSGRVSKVQSPKVLALDSVSTTDPTLHSAKLSSKSTTFPKNALPTSPSIKSPTLPAQPALHIVDPAVTEINIHASNKNATHSRTGLHYDKDEPPSTDFHSTGNRDVDSRARFGGRPSTDSQDSYRQEKRIKSPALKPAQQQSTAKSHNAHERGLSDHSISSQLSAMAPLTLAPSSKSTREESGLSRMVSVTQDNPPLHRHTAKSPDRRNDGPMSTNSASKTATQGAVDSALRLKHGAGIAPAPRPVERLMPKVSQSRLPGFKSSRTSSIDSDLNTLGSRLSKVGSDGNSDVFDVGTFGYHEHSRHSNKLRSRLLNREFWMRDENARDCFHCGEPFTTFRRKHHCRTCGQIFDNKCTLLVSGSHFGSMGAVRVCKPCEMIITSHDDDSSDYSFEDFAISEAQNRPQTPETSHLVRPDYRYDDDNISVVSQSLDMAKTPTMSLPAWRALEAGNRSRPTLEFNTTDRPLARPSSSRSLRTGHPTGHGHRRHHSRHQHIRSFKAYHDDRAPFQRRSVEDTPKQAATSAFHRDSIIDPELAQYLSDDASSEDEQSLQMVLEQDKPIRADNDKTAIGGLLAAVRKGRSRIGDRSIASFLNLSRDADEVSVISNRGVEGAKVYQNRTHSVSSSTHRVIPKTKDRVQIIVTNSPDNQTTNTAPPLPLSRVSKMIRSASLHGLSAPSMELNRASLLHVHRLLQQLLEDSNIGKVSRWQDALVPILLKATDDVDPDVAGGDDMDIRNYVKLKKIPGGRPTDTAYISGLVFTKNVALKSMARLIMQPRILIVAFPLEYARYEQHFMSLDPVIRQEREYLDNLVNRIASFKPDLLLAERNISGLALELLDKANIATVFNVKLSVLEAVSRITQTRIVSSVDKLTSGMGQLGTCDSFEVKTFVFDGRRKNYIYLSGCSPRLGCTIVLRGGDRKTLAKIKRITEFMVYVVYNLKLETCLMRDEWALIPTTINEKPSSDAVTKVEGQVVSPTGRASFTLPNDRPSSEDARRKSGEAVSNSDATASAHESLPATLSKVNSTETADIPDDIPVPTFYEDLVQKHETKILSASPFVKFMQPYLLMRARELERRVAYLKRLRDQDVSIEEAAEDRTKSQKFTLIQPDMVHASLSGASKRVRQVIHAVHDTEYDRALHNYETQKKQWEAYLSGNRNLFDPYAHQNICVTFSLVSTTTSVPCSGPDLLAFGFYNEHEQEEDYEADCTLGQYVEDLCYRAGETCSAESCGRKMHEHHRQYVHGVAQITVFVQPHPPKMRGLQDVILMWSQCRICSVETTVTPMSASTWKYSFGKYLELSFWSRDLHARAGICPHDLHRDHLRFFGYKDFALRVHYDPIEILEIIVPRMRITWKVDNDLRYKNDVYTRIEHRITKLMVSVKLRLKSINLDAVPPEKVEDCRAEIERFTKRANEQHVMLIKQLQENYTNSKHYETIPMASAIATGQDLVAEWDAAFSEFEQTFLPSEKDIRRLAALQLKKIFLDRDVSVTSLPTDEGASTPPLDDSITEKSIEILEDEKKGPNRRPTLSAEKTQTVLQSVLEEHSAEIKQSEDDAVSNAPPAQGIDISKMPLVYAGQPNTDDIRHLDLAVPTLSKSAGTVGVAPLVTADSPDLQVPAAISQDVDNYADEVTTEKIHSRQSSLGDSTNSTNAPAPLIAEPIPVPAGGTHPVNTPINPRRTSDGKSVSPVIQRAQSQPSGSSVLKRETNMAVIGALTAMNASNGFGSSVRQVASNSGIAGDSNPHEKKISDRLGLGHLKNNKFVKSHSFIPRAVNNRKESRVSNLAKHFEQLSREFERERIRERKMHASRNRHSRVFPLAVSKAIVEVYRDVDEAVNEKEDSTNIFNLGDEDESIKEPGDGANTVEGLATTVPTKTHGEVFHPEDIPVETVENETEVDIEASSHAPSEMDDKSSVDETSEDICLPDSPEDLLRMSQEDLELKELPKHERTSLMKMLTNFWAERSSSGWSSLDYPLLAGDHVFADCSIIVREDEPSSLVAFALDSADYKTMLRNIQEHPAACLDDADLDVNIDALEMQADVLHSLLRKTGTHFKYQFQEGPAKMLCKIFFAEQFDAVRRKCGVADRIVESLSRCMKWDSKGGKTKSLFLKTADDRFVLKSLSPIETQSFLKFAPNYFQIMSEAFFHELPSVIAKMLGFYQIVLKNPATGVEYNWYLLLMENLFYDRTPTRIFDLKGSMRNRKINATGERNEVLLDENMVEFIYESPLFAREHSKKLLRSSVHNDTLFLARQNVMDYSLMIAIDESRKELVVGIIDCIRTYTWDKKLESWIKDRGFAGGGKNRPTVTSPKEYKRRFREAMGRYVLEAPSCWHQIKPAKGERRTLNLDGDRDGDRGDNEVQILA